MRAEWTLLALTIMLGVGGYKAWAVWRQGLWRDPKVRAHLVFWTNGVLGMGLLLGPVAVAVNEWTGMNNLAWLLAYLALLLPGYLVGVQVSAGFPVTGPRIRLLLKWGFLTTTALLILLYVGWLWPSPEWPARTARTLADVLFIGLFFTTISSLPILTLALIRDSFRRKPTLAFRLRMSVSAVAMMAALVCFGSKIAGAVAAYALPTSTLGGQLDQVAWVAMGLTAAGWLVSMLPSPVFLAMVGPVLYVGTLRTLQELRKLYAWVTALVPPVVDYAPTWRELLRQPDFHRYRLVIGILDGRKMIMGQATARRRHSGLTSGPQRPVTVAWSKRQWVEAEVLEHLLRDVRAEEMEELVGELVAVSREAEAVLPRR